MSDVPKHSMCEFNPTRERRTELFQHLVSFPEALKFFGTLGGMPHVARLSVNLRVVCACLAKAPVKDILRDGLTHTEKKHLLQLETVLPEDLLKVAHGLLDVHQRWLLVRTLSKQFYQASHADLVGIQVEYKPLDPILGND